jgi:hypothetical protein
MTSEYAIITVLTAVATFLAGFGVSQLKVANKVSAHDVKIQELQSAIDRLCQRLDHLIEQNTKIIEQNTTLILKMGLENK